MTRLARPVARRLTPTLTIAGAGVAIGLAYTLSPLTVLSLAVIATVACAASEGLSAAERRWFWFLLCTATLMRLIAIAGLFLTADPSQPFASFFGDEELYKFRTVWIRNLGQDIPISPADVIYSFDDVGRTEHLFALALIQALVGDAPYGLHMLSVAVYVCGVLLLYRFTRASFGGVVALGGLAGLMFIPSLAIWSMSVLKEPMNVLALAAELLCAVYVVRAPLWWQKVLAAAGVASFGLVMDSLRGGGWVTAIGGTVAGVAGVWLVARGRRVLVALMLAPIMLAALVSMPPVQERLLTNLRETAFHHAGHVVTAGFTYELINPRYYPNRVQILRSMPADDLARYFLAAIWSYFVQPVPWAASRPVRAYLPEQVAWYGMVLLLPFGVAAGLRRDRALTMMLVTHAAAAVVVVALTSGNVGTLIRHRSLVLLYLIWLSAIGAHDCIRRMLARRVDPTTQRPRRADLTGGREEGSRADGDR
jgi:hypothetical protein